MVDSKKPGEKPAAAESKPKERPQGQSISNAEKAAKAKAFVKAQKEEQNKSDTADYSETKADKPQKKTPTGLLWFFLLCTLGLSAAAGYGVYYLWQQWQVEQSNAQSRQGELKQTQTAIVDVRDDFKTLQNELGEQSASRAAELATTQNTIKLLEKTVGKQNRQIQGLTQINRDEWLLAETEYLLRLANQRILMSREIGGALAMLQSADKILRDIDDVSLHPVRRAIAGDITALSRTSPVDVDGEYLKLATLTESIDELVLHDIPEFSNDEQEAPVEASMPAQPTWRDSVARVFGAIKATLGKVFVVRQHGKPVEVMLPPQQELYLRQNLRLMLEQAQLALLARKPDTYQQSLDKAQQWIARYFINEDAGTQAALETLESARTIDIDPPLPDISGSYHALKEYTDSANSRKLKASAAQQMRRQEQESEEEVEPAPRAKPKAKPEPEVEQARPAKPKSEPKKESKTSKEPEQEATSEESQADAKAKPESAEQPKAEVKPEPEPAKKPEEEAKPKPKSKSEPNDPETTSAEEEVTAAVTEG